MADQETMQGKLTTAKGEFTYSYYLFHNSTYNFDTYAFNIWDENDQEEKHKADFSLLIMNDDVHLKVIDLFMHDYQGKGIARAIILKAKEIFNKRIVSSSNVNKTFTGESNWPEAIKRVWKPLAEEGLAVYDEINGYYILVDDLL
ncbi:MAG: hypothetical protein JWQ34_2615 [Mucilaginibacter sp.]|uniref:hypothetical protein n=1 Tax=Mucilaginibacter sp. TaxID=1882438 RepID=UPI00262783AF|nr:hypothetical protein [Mucilaginibacter sp.]MDB5004390.1 hypothetical protein [Mucilaginibacter sp.]